MSRKFADFPPAPVRETSPPVPKVLPPEPAAPKPEKWNRTCPPVAKGSLGRILTDSDVHKAYEQLIAATEAVDRRFLKAPGEQTGIWSDVPDWKVRLEAARLILAYAEGLPVQRSEAVTVNIESKAELMEKAKRSPALARIAHRLFPNGKPAEPAGQAPTPADSAGS